MEPIVYSPTEVFEGRAKTAGQSELFVKENPVIVDQCLYLYLQTMGSMEAKDGAYPKLEDDEDKKNGIENLFRFIHERGGARAAWVLIRYTVKFRGALINLPHIRDLGLDHSITLLTGYDEAVQALRPSFPSYEAFVMAVEGMLEDKYGCNTKFPHDPFLKHLTRKT
jgi:hypothetical protein